MTGKFVLDTNIVIGLFSNDQVIVDKLQSISEIFLPSIVLGELYFGALNSYHHMANLQRIEEFASGVMILDCNEKTAREFAELKIQLKRAGHPIPENDLWIAAIAKQYQLILVTRDSHFRGIVGLRIEDW